MIYITENEKGNIICEERFTDYIMFHNKKVLDAFIQYKTLEGLSKNTLTYYSDTIKKMNETIGKRYEDISSKEIRTYLSNYQLLRNVSNLSIDNMRRALSSFYNFLEDENYVLRNPVRKIHKIKYEKKIQSAFTEEEIIKLQDNCITIKELAIIDFLNSSGVRVSELISLNINDINLVSKEGIVKGKGNKERIFYIDARTKIHLEDYLQSRHDKNPALFIANEYRKEPKRLSKVGVEFIVSSIGTRAGISPCYPHRFRRTLATRLINRGVPIEQVQAILGHEKIETTLIYAQVNQGNVKISHSKFC